MRTEKTKKIVKTCKTPAFYLLIVTNFFSTLKSWCAPEIGADDTEARLFLSQYLTKCPVMLSRMSIERKGDSDVVWYTSDKGSKEFSPLDFMAALSAHIPNKFEQTIRYNGSYC